MSTGSFVRSISHANHDGRITDESYSPFEVFHLAKGTVGFAVLGRTHSYRQQAQHTLVVVPWRSGHARYDSKSVDSCSRMETNLTLVGLTAYSGWKKFTKPKKGDTVFVTTAAGPVGAYVE